MFENVVFRLEQDTLFLDCESVKVAQKLSKDANHVLCFRLSALIDAGILEAKDLWIGMNGVTFAHVNIQQQVMYRRRVKWEKSLSR